MEHTCGPEDAAEVSLSLPRRERLHDRHDTDKREGPGSRRHACAQTLLPSATPQAKPKPESIEARKAMWVLPHSLTTDRVEKWHTRPGAG